MNICGFQCSNFPELFFSVRSEMREYWKEHSKESSAKEMMLDSKGELLVNAEIDEIMSYLPSLSGKDVIELGAGIGLVFFFFL